MGTTHVIRRSAAWLAGGAGLAAISWGAYAAVAWARYGQVRQPLAEESDPLLDAFIPNYEVVERHHVRVAAPVDVTFATAGSMDLMESSVVRAIFRGRELIMGTEPDREARPGGLLAQVKSLGWGVLAQVPGREIVMGAVTQPWEPDATFRAILPGHFAGFDEPGYVKIAWTLRVDPGEPGESIFRTETRVATTDPRTRAKFRRYWAWFSPGMTLIRRAMLGVLKSEAERRTHTTHPAERLAA